MGLATGLQTARVTLADSRDDWGKMCTLEVDGDDDEKGVIDDDDAARK